MATLQSDGVNHTSDLILRRNGTEGLRLTSSTVQLSSINDGYISGYRNRIQNGTMLFNQRGFVETTFGIGNAVVVDRWRGFSTIGSVMRVGSSTDAPPGFQYSIKHSAVASATLGVNDYFLMLQGIEGWNIRDLDFGKASAKSFTISFYVKSSVTGTHSGACRNSGNPSYRSIAFTYTITTANTWERKFVTLPGDTSGTWSLDGRLDVIFDLGSGSTYRKTAYPFSGWTTENMLGATGAVSPMATSGATWFITGVQLEPGIVATPYEFISVVDELYILQRYCSGLGNGDTLPVTTFANQARGFFKLPVVMRTFPTCTFGFDAGSGAVFAINGQGGYQATAHSQASGFSVLADADL